ncbi:MAG: histidine triad nucleotide-binding protein [Tissierellia bacterium]|nr:histidine triad nucleotide-binding protein [Tissierellia bacterium]
MDCVFCKIINGEIPSNIIYEDQKVIAFKDQNPQAPIHFLVIPKKHIESNDKLEDSDKELIGHIFTVIRDLAREFGISEDGYRIVNNTGEDGGQSVAHMHFHVLGKRSMQWPPG